jgi:hypothetical protein
MPLRATIDSRQLREASKIVREIDPEIRKGFVRDLKADLRPYASEDCEGYSWARYNLRLSGMRRNWRDFRGDLPRRACM